MSFLDSAVGSRLLLELKSPSQNQSRQSIQLTLTTFSGVETQMQHGSVPAAVTVQVVGAAACTDLIEVTGADTD